LADKLAVFAEGKYLAQPETKLLLGMQRLALATEIAGAKPVSHVLQGPRVLPEDIELYSWQLAMIPSNAHSLTVALLTLTATPGVFAERAPPASHASGALQKAFVNPESVQSSHCKMAVDRVTLSYASHAPKTE
jgi:hypothetical protein